MVNPLLGLQLLISSGVPIEGSLPECWPYYLTLGTMAPPVQRWMGLAFIT